MIGKILVAGERRNAQAVRLGTVIVTPGVLLHQPMLLKARDMG
jgi:hypothetical protein